MNKQGKDPLSALEGSIPALIASVDRGVLGNALSAAISALQKSADRLQRLSAVADFVPIVGKHSNGQVIEAALDSLQKFGKELKDVSTSEGLRSVSFSISSALTNIQTVESEVKRGWEIHVTHNIGPTDRLGKVLSEIDELKAVGRELIAVSTQARALALAVDDAKRQQFTLDDLTKRAEKAKSKAIMGDKVVDNFLAILADEKATLADVTPAVLAWVKKVGALKQLSVRI